MRSAHFVPALFAITLVIGCTSPAAEVVPPASAFNRATMKALLDSLNVHYHDRFRDSTATYFSERYTTDACVMAPDMPRVCGIERIAAFYWNNGDSQTTTLDIVGEELSGNDAEVTEVGSYRVIDDEGTVLETGKFIAIYRNDKGTWKVHREIWNSDGEDEPSPETASGQTDH